MSTGQHRVFVGRQAILGVNGETCAYELLFRQGHATEANVRDGNSATAGVLLNTVAEFGLDRVVGDKLAFINLTRDHLMGDSCQLLPRGRVVLEVLENVEPDPAIVQSVSRLRNAGYIIALDDFVYRDELRPLIELATIIKLEALDSHLDTLARQVELLKQFSVKLLAEKVETHGTFDFCRSLGFDYFQGYFFCRPQTLEQTSLPPNRLSAMRLLARVNDPAIRTDELAAAVSQDVSVTYNLLRFVNSGATAVPRAIQSVRHAIQLVGIWRIRCWASLLVMASLDDKPRELLETAIVRARTCEELARACNFDNAEEYFTAGLFSVLDALLDIPMAEALQMLPLSDNIQRALLHRAGPLGRTLDCAIRSERGDWSRGEEAGIDPGVANDAFIGAVEWARQLTSEMGL